MTHLTSMTPVPVSITLPVWEIAIEAFDFSQWEYRQNMLIRAVLDAWSQRSIPEASQVLFSLTLFAYQGEELNERTQNFVARYVDNVLVVTLGGSE
ncbi:hypothetical protein [Klebsiella oxytoca]|uniref:hypothetical protein n=1 Tax=Klebsiella oxytoca TaxID=571 RepID=UPI0039C8D327